MTLKFDWQSYITAQLDAVAELDRKANDIIGYEPACLHQIARTRLADVTTLADRLSQPLIPSI